MSIGNVHSVRLRAATLAVLFAFAFVPRAQSQSSGVDARAKFVIGGTVRSAKGDALEGAEVRVGSATTLSKEDGTFTLRDIPAESVTVSVRRLGYATAELPVSPAAAGQRVQLAVVLSENAVALSRIVVEAKAYDSNLWDAGFYHRERIGSGRFLAPEFWAHFTGAGVGTVMRETPRVIVNRDNNKDYALVRSGSNTCRMNVFVDGAYAKWASPADKLPETGSAAPLSRDTGESLDDIVPRSEIYAMEIFPSVTSVPVQFQRTAAVEPNPIESFNHIPGRSNTRSPTEKTLRVDCGAIVIWTKSYSALAASP